VVSPGLLAAQTAADYFHRGAQHYIWGQKQQATNQILTGLRAYPTDRLLNEMAVLLQRQEEQKQNQQKQQQQQNQDEQKQDQQQQQQQQQQQDQQQQSQDQQQQQQAGKEQQQAAAQEEEKQGEEPPEGGEPTPDQMTREQAEQLLEAQRNEEKLLPPKPQGKPADHSRPFKDW
jgi:hypothetical protein